jgi:signal transduction histidine kinase
MTGTGTEAMRRGVLARVVWPVFSARTWLAITHLLAGLFTGLIAGIVVIVGISVGVSLVPLFLIGVPVLASVFWLCAQFARAERARFALLLGGNIAAPPPPPAAGTGWRRALRTMLGPAPVRHLCYALLRFPLSAIQAAIMVTIWSLGLALVALPAYNRALPGGGVHLGDWTLAGHGREAAAVIAGLILLLIAPPLTRGLAAADAVVGRRLLGPRGDANLTARIGELERSRAGVVGAAETERRRIERDLHDGAQQRLVSLAMELGRARAKFGTDPEAAAAIVDQAHEQAKEALTELRNLVRGVHPPVLSDRGLDAALSGLAALSPVPVTVRVDLPARPPAGIEAIAYFVVAEALTNVAKHARASHAEVTVDRSGEMLRVTIRDDGVGGADPAGQGLSGLASRAAGVDGRLSVSSPAGGPTSIEVLLPCGS